ncbi:2673_t:CDS:2 [Dentiscutata heterogama]|uniref:2673_t:CDS:1 n=1 Tax=Dentiscutata heterogama TaxID=1316150 RepID=A0ACA9L8S2_9GLOM|nr:2673_t:CDS:2 [Dentiscutata heterogama]
MQHVSTYLIVQKYLRPSKPSDLHKITRSSKSSDLRPSKSSYSHQISRPSKSSYSHQISQPSQSSSSKNTSDTEYINKLKDQIYKLENDVLQWQNTANVHENYINMLEDKIKILEKDIENNYKGYIYELEDKIKSLEEENDNIQLLNHTKKDSKNKIDLTTRKELRYKIFEVLKEKGPKYSFNIKKPWCNQEEWIVKNTIPLLQDLGLEYNVTNKYLLQILEQRHRSQRKMLKVKLDPEKYELFKKRTHKNNHHSEKLLRRAKALNFLQSTENKLVEKYNSEELKALICSRDVYSPEISDAEDYDKNNKKYINCYNLPWRSDELKKLLRKVLDPVALRIAPLHRSRRYNDEVYYIEDPALPTDAPDWAVKSEIRKRKRKNQEVVNNKKRQRINVDEDI